ncbi:MAG: PAS domain S-box protein, partial [Planctomycetaceae bacterium]|nr:PAS domain S-box protein [Planctomycetaceae bacterium]
MASTTLPLDEQQLLRCVVDASPAGMVIANSDGKIVLVNPAAVAQFGYSAEELVGSQVDRLIPKTYRSTHHQHRSRYMSNPEHRPMAAGRNLFGRRQDGTTFPVDISLHPINWGGEQMVLANVLDATDRHRAEQEREQRLAMERLALMGQLAGGVAHEIRTPLCVIRNDAYYLKLMEGQLSEEGVQCVNEINEAVGKAERIVSELLDFTRDAACQPVVKGIRELVDAAFGSLNIPEAITVLDDHAGAIDVLADPGQIERILINLIRNAIESMNDSGTVEILLDFTEDLAPIEVI